MIGHKSRKEQYFPQPSTVGSQQHFAEVPTADIERSRFDRSHGHKTTFNAGQLIPVYLDEVLPGDTFDMESTAFCRLATPIRPFMDNLYLDTHFFYVPNRIIWANWVALMGENRTGGGIAPTVTPPTQTVNVSTIGDDFILHHMGVPRVAGSPPTPNQVVSSLPWRAYCLIFNEWYRDENIQAPININYNTDGPDVPTSVEQRCLPRYKRKDYFTSCLPWPQKGTAVSIPIATQAPVRGTGQPFQMFPFNVPADLRNITFTTSAGVKQLAYSGTNLAGESAAWSTTAATTGLVADLSTAGAVTINDLRTAFQVQKLLERDARGGTRYIEIVLSHFGVHSPDARNQRPEYLGGGVSMVNINPVARTADSLDTTFQYAGFLGAVGNVVGRGRFKKSFTEHGFVIGIVSVRQDYTYQHGLEKLWKRTSRLDFYWPALSHLGEQAVLNREIFLSTNATTDAGVFGYQERYGEYRFKCSRVTGKFQSQLAQGLDIWHLAQDFTVTPTLSNTFLAEGIPIARVVQVTTEPHFLCDIWFRLICDRPMPVYAVPGLIDHF